MESTNYQKASKIYSLCAAALTEINCIGVEGITDKPTYDSSKLVLETKRIINSY